MAATTGRQPTDLIAALASDGRKFDFYQTLRLLEEYWQRGEVGNGLDRHLHLTPDRSMAFPSADVKSFAQDEQGDLHIKLGFMGLYGVDAPLPHYFLEKSLQDNEMGERMRAFADMFNQHIYSLLYLVWKKYHPSVQLHDKEARYPQYLKALSGALLAEDDTQEFAFAAQLGKRVRSGIGLSGVLHDFLGDVAVNTKQFVARWAKLDEAPRLGEQALGLGDNAVLGDQILDVMSKVDVRIGPIELDQAMDLLPGHARSTQLTTLISRYLGALIDFTVVLIVKPAKTQCLALGDPDLKLGWASWLGERVDSQYELRFAA